MSQSSDEEQRATSAEGYLSATEIQSQRLAPEEKLVRPQSGRNDTSVSPTREEMDLVERRRLRDTEPYPNHADDPDPIHGE